MSSRPCCGNRALLAIVLASTAACRSGEPTTVTLADGAVVAPSVDPKAYVPRLKALGMKYLLVPWTTPTTDVAGLAASLRGTDLKLIVGLTAARRLEDEWNAPTSPVTGLDQALERALAAGDALAGVHLDHAEPGLPDSDLAAYFDQTVARIRARTRAPISFALRARSISRDQLIAAGLSGPAPDGGVRGLDSRNAAFEWATRWAAVLSPRVDRVVVHTENAARDDIATVRSDLEILKSALGNKAELWATVESMSPISPVARGQIARVRPARPRDEIQAEAALLRGIAPVVLVHGANAFSPDQFLTSKQETRPSPEMRIDPTLEARARDMDARLRRCCLRDGQLTTVFDHRFERERGDNTWQEDACWLTGLYASAMSFRYAATEDPEAAAEAREAWRALHQMANTTPLKGEVVRNFARQLYGTQPQPPGGETLKRWRRADDKELYWIGDVSVDQLSGWFNGVAVYHDLVATADEKREIASDVSAVLDVFMAHDLRAIEFTGQPTTFGDLRGMPVLALAFFQIGFHITGDEKYRMVLDGLIEREGMQLGIARVLSLYHLARRFGSDHFYSSGLYPLVMYETDRRRRAGLEISFALVHDLERRHGDAYADLVYAVFHPDTDTGRRAAQQIAAYRPELSENALWMRERSTVSLGPFVPLADRPAGELDFDYVPPGRKDLRGGLEHRFTGVGFLIAYWMGRYHGLLGVED